MIVYIKIIELNFVCKLSSVYKLSTQTLFNIELINVIYRK